VRVVSWLLELIRTLWPVAIVVMPLVTGAGFLWLKTQFPSKTDFDTIQQRLAEGSRKLSDLDKRVALVEDDCESSPSKQDLSNLYAALAGRTSGVETALRGLEKALNTQNDYVHTLIEKAIKG
jgi:hypothetical protein